MHTLTIEAPLDYSFHHVVIAILHAGGTIPNNNFVIINCGFSTNPKTRPCVYDLISYTNNLLNDEGHHYSHYAALFK